MPFTQSQALIIGVGRFAHLTASDAEIEVSDARVLDQVIKDPKFCGYPIQQVEMLDDDAVTLTGSLTAPDRFAKRAGEHNTAFLLYCGHGAIGTDRKYYLISHDAKVEKSGLIPESGVSESELIIKPSALKSNRDLLIFHSRFSGNISPAVVVEQVHDGAMAMGKAAKVVGRGGILIEGKVKGNVIGAGGKKITGGNSDDR